MTGALAPSNSPPEYKFKDTSYLFFVRRILPKTLLIGKHKKIFFVKILTDTSTIFESSFWGGAEALLFLKLVIRNFLVQKVVKCAGNGDF